MFKVEGEGEELRECDRPAHPGVDLEPGGALSVSGPRQRVREKHTDPAGPDSGLGRTGSEVVSKIGNTIDDNLPDLSGIPDF